MVTQQPARPVAMAGVGDSPELEALIKQLFDKGVTVEHLRKLADMPKMKIQSLLLML